MPDITLQAIGFRVVTLMVLAGVQGGVVSATSVLLGDKGPKYDGRLTLVPISHIDPVGAIGLIFYGNGWAKPVAVDAEQFRVGPVGLVVVILAGFAGVIVTAAALNALVLPALTILPHTAALAAAAFLRTASDLAIWFALFSLVPIPPLTGGLLVGVLAPQMPRMERILALLLLVAVATGVVRLVLGPAHSMVASFILGA
ncbi:hypothetical protein EF888_07230 [Silicimonas algicola]|uniref:hypothetical protein n=1 Tax=Silicimonas algicola TaxID=1826607 RepID=UPI000D6BE3A4|nr:hypothetical protein [Silicimonas algicola]AZQ66948.1 hypothetical protein EF888_07230 [Silicimonas algicola]